jgi:hypothetical protein
MLKNFLKLILVLGFCIPFIYGGCGGGGGGDKTIFRIDDHQVDIVDLECLDMCDPEPTWECVTAEGCFEPINDDEICIGLNVAATLEFQNDNGNTVSATNQIIDQAGDIIDGPYTIDLKEELDGVISGKTALLFEEIDTIGSFTVEFWMTDSNGRDTAIYEIDVVVSDCSGGGSG